MTKKRIFEIIQVGNAGDFPSRTYDILSMIAVVINIVIAIFDTFEAASAYSNIINVIETITVLFFTVDYILRIWTATYLYREVSSPRAKMKYISSGGGIVDFLSCIPFWIPFLFPHGETIWRMFRVIRILRIFRISHYSDPLAVIARVMEKKKSQLLSSVFIVFILMVVASLLMYSLEHDAQPEVFSNAFSGFWWAASSLLTVGYGDIVPITFAGKILGTAITFLGVILIAVPTGIMSAGFVEETSRRINDEKKSGEYCPYCGKKYPK